MSKYVLTNNKIEYDGHTLYQIKRANWSNEYGGYIEDIGILSQDDDSWVEEGACVYGESLLQGKIIVKKGAVVKDSELYGNIEIEEDCTLINCNITPVFHDGRTTIKNNTIIQNKTMRTVGSYNNKLFNDGKFEVLSNNVIELILTDNYCRVNCQTFTYEIAWKIINNDNKLQLYVDKFFNREPMLFSKNNLKWLKEMCAKELLRKYKIPYKE